MTKSLKARGMVCALASAFFFGVTPFWGKSTFLLGSNSTNLVFFRSLLALPFLAFLALRKGGTLYLPRQGRGSALLGGVFMGITTLMLYAAYYDVSIGIATTLHFTYPLVVALLGRLFFKEKLPWRTWAALGVSVAGVSLLAEGGEEAGLMGMVLALGSGVVFAGYIMCMHAPSLQGTPSFTLAFYACLASAVVAGVFGLCTGQLVWNMPVKAYLLTFAVSLGAMVLAMTLLQCGVRWAGAMYASALSLLEPLTGVAIGVLCFGEGFSLYGGLGCAMVLLGVGVIVLWDLRPGQARKKGKGQEF